MIDNEIQPKFDLEKTKAEIDNLLAAYRTKKEDLEWADDEWQIGEIQEELDIYAHKIRTLKAKVREYEHEHEQS